MKTLISTLILGAGLVLGGCGNKESELEKYNLENKQVYADFATVFKENKGRKFYFNNEMQGVEFGIIQDFLLVCVDKEERCFSDFELDGMNHGDIYSKNGAEEFIEDMPPEKQLSVAKEYKNLLKEILHEGKHENYELLLLK